MVLISSSPNQARASWLLPYAGSAVVATRAAAIALLAGALHTRTPLAGAIGRLRGLEA